MYGKGSGVAASVTTTAAGAALLPQTGGSEFLHYLGLMALIGGTIATIAQFAVIGYRRFTLK